MANSSNLITGKAYWFKAVGAPVPAYEQPKDAPITGREWTFDLAIDAKTKAEVKKLGIESKIKNNGDERGDYLTFKRRAVKADNVTPNNPIKLVDHHGRAWDRSVKVGNGSTVNVRFNIYEGRRGAKPVVLAVQIWDLVKYDAPERDSDFPMKAAAAAAPEEEFEVV